MRPTLRQLQYLVAIADSGRFGEAAKKLHVSQPSLSAQVADIEAELGVSLIERGRHGALMTPIGQNIVDRARLILRDVEDLRSAALEGQHGFVGRLKLGVLPSIGPYLLPTAAKRLHAQFPDMRLSVREEKTTDLEAHLVSGLFDVIISTAEDHADHLSAQLFDEELWACAAPDDPISASTAPLNISALKDRQVLSLGPGHRLSELIGEVAQKGGGRVSEEYHGTSLDATRQMAIMGTGVAILPTLYVKREAQRDRDIVLRPIDHKMARRTISLIWRRGSPLTKRFGEIAETLKEISKELLK